MALHTTAPALVGDREIIATRDFDAPRALVFEAWTNPQHLHQWWGPDGFTTTTQHCAVRPGGEWRFVMHGPDGRDYPNKIAFIEVVRPERLVYKHFGDEHGEPVRFETTVTFADHGGKTRLTMRMVFETAQQRDYAIDTYGAVEGLEQTLGRLGDYVQARHALLLPSGQDRMTH